MKQEVKDFLSKAEIKLVEPYLVRDTNGYELLVIAEHPALIDKALCIDKDGKTRWITKFSLTPTQSKSRSIEDGLVEGDIITNFFGDRKVLMANQYCIALSQSSLDKADGIYTYSELIADNYTLKQ